MNILIKLTSIVALIIAPHISGKDHSSAQKTEENKTKTEIVINASSSDAAN
jgi:K(+)-stimulated pyrophosphate-energized sodium pump